MFTYVGPSTPCPCDAGWTGPDGACTECVAGTYTAVNRTAACESCPANSTSPVQSTVSTNCTCNAGFSGPNGGGCTECVTGTYKAVIGSAACEACPANSTSSVRGSGTCYCDLGYIGPVGGPCTKGSCPENTYSHQGACLACPTESPASASGSHGLVSCFRVCTREYLRKQYMAHMGETNVDSCSWAAAAFAYKFSEKWGCRYMAGANYLCAR